MQDWTDSLVRNSARTAVMLFFTAWTVRILVPPQAMRMNQRARAAFQIAWSLGALALILHDALAIHLVHGDSHARALAHTAKRTQQQIGLAVGWGLYWNYLMSVWWLADVAWMQLFPNAYWRRHIGFEWATWTFFAFMVGNATVIFETEIARLIGLLGFTIAAAAFLYRATNQTAIPPIGSTSDNSRQDTRDRGSAEPT